MNTTIISPRMIEAGVAAQGAFDRFDDSEETKAELATAIYEAMEAKRVESEADLQSRYDELIYAVSMKFENETRHETALRYIRNAESARYGELVPGKAESLQTKEGE